MIKRIELPKCKTPIIEIEDESNRIFIKREDMLPFSFGGNKVRIAVEYLNDMYKEKRDCIISYGNVRSNLNRAIANLCNKNNIDCYIVCPIEDDDSIKETFNSKIVKNCNAEIINCLKTNVSETIEKLFDRLVSQGKNPYYVYGNSLGKGNEHIPVKAYQKVYNEIKNKYDFIFLAVGTGMTMCGLLIGKALNNGKEKIVGISIAREEKVEKAKIQEMLEAYSNNIRKVNVKDVVIDDSYLFGGYGKYSKEIEDTINEQMEKNGMPLDPTYTGKAFYGMKKYLKENKIENKKILFIHTGGTPLFFDYYK